MKRLIVSAMVISILVPTYSVAQRTVASGMGRAMGFPGNSGPTTRTMNGMAPNFNGFGWPAYPYYGGYGYLANYSGEGYQPQPNVILVTPPQEVPVAPPPPPPARPEMHEYHWPSSGSDPEAVFSIVSKDGSIQHAIAVWVQDTTVHFIAPDGTGGQVPLSGVNRERTYRANTQQNLRLPLPAESTSAIR